MREFSLATQILEDVLEFSHARSGADVRRIGLEIGELMGIDVEQLSFCFDSIKNDTALKNASLDVEIAPGAVRCLHCGHEGAPKYLSSHHWAESIPAMQCEKCGRAAEAIRGHDCAIKAVELFDWKTFQDEPDLYPGRFSPQT